MQFFRSLIFSLLMMTNTAIIAASTFVLIFFPFQTRAKYIKLYPKFNIWLLKVICGVRYEVKGIENIPKDQSYIVFSTHQSTWETFAYQLIFPGISFVIKKELLYVPLFGWALALLKPIAIKRSSGRAALKQLIEQGIERLKEGIIIVIFPEGTRMPPNSNAEYKKGGGILAEQSGYVVLPVAHNAGYYWPKRGFLKKKGTITVHIGEPIISKGKKARDITQEAEKFIRANIDSAKYE